MRICKLDGCEASLEGMRSDAEYCTPDHRREASKRRYNVEGARAFWSRLGRKPRFRPAVRV